MTKKAFLIATATLAMLTSCNSDSPEVKRTSDVWSLNLVSPISNDAESSIVRTRYVADLNYTSENVTLTLASMKIGNETFSFQSPVMKYTYSDNRFTMNFNTPSLTPINGSTGTFSNLRGCLTNAVCTPPKLDSGNVVFNNLDVINATYTIDGKYIVTTFPQDCVYYGETKTTTGNGETPYSNTDICYRVAIDAQTLTADVTIYNAKFNPNMPVSVNIALRGLKVTPGKGTYTIEGENVVPVNVIENTPFPAFTFSSFKLVPLSQDLTSARIDYTIPVSEKLYSGTFMGSYRLTINN